jgi:ornithine lipid ester-linked acyl 2-hydroxylase
MDMSLNLPLRVWHVLVGLVRHPRGGSVWLMFRIMKSLIGLTKNGRVTFYPKEQLPWVAELEANWKSIRTELDAVLVNVQDVPNTQDEYRGQEELTQDDKWKTFTLIRGSRKIEKNAVRCPETTKLLQRIPNLTNGFFSILAGRKHLAAHRGPYGGLLNCHLGLLVPPDRTQCRIRVGDDTLSWEEGKLLVFDDSNEHEVWNDSDTTRVVLLMYVLRPLPFPLSVLNRVVIRVATILLRDDQFE